MTKLRYFLENAKNYSDIAEVKYFGDVPFREDKFPLISVHFGKPQSPCLLIIGGVHGLERIGAQLSLSLLNSFHERLHWDNSLKSILEHVQVVFIPLVNPVGYFETRRSNGNGVDLMRNAPLLAEEKVPLFLGGQKYSSSLPWYTGHELQLESQFLIQTVNSILQQTDILISLDLHSGFGFQDQIWFPFAGSKRKFPKLIELYSLFKLFERNYPYHVYCIEPQSKNYPTHGDLWDYCYMETEKQSSNKLFLPLTLEMGSWLWVKKNPLQLFSKTGLFNPLKKHRLNRTLRRHRSFFDFLVYSLYSYKSWSQPTEQLKKQLEAEANEKFYVRK